MNCTSNEGVSRPLKSFRMTMCLFGDWQIFQYELPHSLSRYISEMPTKTSDGGGRGWKQEATTLEINHAVFHFFHCGNISAFVDWTDFQSWLEPLHTQYIYDRCRVINQLILVLLVHISVAFEFQCCVFRLNSINSPQWQFSCASSSKALLSLPSPLSLKRTEQLTLFSLV